MVCTAGDVQSFPDAYCTCRVSFGWKWEDLVKELEVAENRWERLNRMDNRLCSVRSGVLISCQCRTAELNVMCMVVMVFLPEMEVGF
jgi:hypothetical protein